MRKLLEITVIFSVALYAYKKYIIFTLLLSLMVGAILTGFHTIYFMSHTSHWSSIYIVGDPIDGGGMHVINLSQAS